MAAAWPVTLAVRLLLLEPIQALCRRACRLGEGCACYWAGRCYYLPDSAARWHSFSFGATLTLLVAVLAPIATSIGIVRGPFSMGGQGSGCGFRFSLPYMADNASRSSVLRQAAAFSGGSRRSSSRRPRASPPLTPSPLTESRCAVKCLASAGGLAAAANVTDLMVHRVELHRCRDVSRVHQPTVDYKSSSRAEVPSSNQNHIYSVVTALQLMTASLY